jgi:tetratricopeptide (TPR) repeat protein
MRRVYRILAFPVLLCLLWPASAHPASALPAETSDEHRQAEAYYQFLLGRYLEGAGEIDLAVEAHRKAVDLDPQSSELRSELAGLYARQNRADDAIALAEEALQVSPDNPEAHRILGTIYAALAEQELSGEAGRGRTSRAREHAEKAIAHFERAQDPQGFDPGLHLALGRLYLSVGEPAKAVPVLRRLQAFEPGLPEGLLLLARAYASEGNAGEAIQTLETAVAAEPRFYRAFSLLGELYEQERRWSEAARAYQQAFELNPRNFELQGRRAAALLNAGEAAEAATLLREVTSARPDGRMLYLLSQAEREQNRFDEAEAAARHLITLEPGELRGPYALALVFERRREYRHVVDTLQPAVDSARQRAVPASQLAMLLAHLGFAHQALQNHARAIDAFQEARSVLPDDPSLTVYVVNAHLKAGDAATALELARQARAHHASELRLLRLEAQALIEQGEADEAIRMMQEAAGSVDGDPGTHVALADVYVQAERHGEAADILESARTRFPDDTTVLFRLGAVRERQQRFEEAERVFRDVLERDPANAPALNYLGYMLADRGERLQESLELIRRALDIDPHNGAYLDSLGWAYYRLNDLVRARQYLQLAADQLPTNSVVQDHLGDVLYDLGQYGDAVAAWERALAGDGESVERHEIERKIRETRDKARHF